MPLAAVNAPAKIKGEPVKEWDTEPNMAIKAIPKIMMVGNLLCLV